MLYIYKHINNVDRYFSMAFFSNSWIAPDVFLPNKGNPAAAVFSGAPGRAEPAKLGGRFVSAPGRIGAAGGTG